MIQKARLPRPEDAAATPFFPKVHRFVAASLEANDHVISKGFEAAHGTTFQVELKCDAPVRRLGTVVVEQRRLEDSNSAFQLLTLQIINALKALTMIQKARLPRPEDAAATPFCPKVHRFVAASLEANDHVISKGFEAAHGTTFQVELKCDAPVPHPTPEYA